MSFKSSRKLLDKMTYWSDKAIIPPIARIHQRRIRSHLYSASGVVNRQQQKQQLTPQTKKARAGLA